MGKPPGPIAPVVSTVTPAGGSLVPLSTSILAQQHPSVVTCTALRLHYTAPHAGCAFRPASSGCLHLHNLPPRESTISSSPPPLTLQLVSRLLLSCTSIHISLHATPSYRLSDPSSAQPSHLAVVNLHSQQSTTALLPVSISTTSTHTHT